MKKLFVALLFVFSILVLPTVQAQSTWTITEFQSDITVQNNGVLLVKEEINVDFDSLEKHGIYRDIPYVYTDASGNKIYKNIKIISVIIDEQTEKYTTSDNNANVRIKIGDANKTISGVHAYSLIYEATGVLRHVNEYDELYWNVTGNTWEAPIQKTNVFLHVQTGVKKVACYEGYTGSSTPCIFSEKNNQETTFTATNTLNPGEGLTIVAGFTPGIIPILTVAPPRTIGDDIGSPTSIAIFLSTLFIGCWVVFSLWWKQGRDYWSKNNPVVGPSERSEVKPIGSHETIVVEFESPELLRPAELGVLLDERADTLDVTATIIDLAGKGFLTITQEPKKWIFGSSDYVLASTKKDTKTLLPYEKLLFNNLFSSGNSIRISDLKTTFYDELAEVKKQLYKDVITKKLFMSNPESTRNKYLGLGFGLIVLGSFFVFMGITTITAILVSLGIGICIAGIFMLVFSRFMPRRTAYGRDLYRRAQGFREFIGGAEQYRQQFYEKKNLFNELLPYAIIFGLTDKFAKAMKDLGLQSQQPGWYSGYAPFNSHVFASDINSFSKSLSTAMASTPSKSGGFSSGSSGGGFGGGGGGSW